MRSSKTNFQLKDTRSFTILCTFGNYGIEKSLCDLRASINLIPLSIFHKLGIREELKPSIASLHLVDHSIWYALGIIEDILVKVGKFYFPADFLVLEMGEDSKIPTILGRPFLVTGKAFIDF